MKSNASPTATEQCYPEIFTSPLQVCCCERLLILLTASARLYQPCFLALHHIFNSFYLVSNPCKNPLPALHHGPITSSVLMISTQASLLEDPSTTIPNQLHIEAYTCKISSTLRKCKVEQISRVIQAPRLGWSIAISLFPTSSYISATYDSCGVRTHALTDWRLKPAP